MVGMDVLYFMLKDVIESAPKMIPALRQIGLIREKVMMRLHLPGAILFGSLMMLVPPLMAQTTKAVDVIVQAVKSQPLESRIEALGTLRANESIRLTSNVTKTVTNINFDDGQRVKKGQVLVEMTNAEERALLDEARFNMEEARKQMERVRSLVETRAASQSLLDQRMREYESAHARYLAIDARLQDLHLDAPFSGVVGLRNISVGALVSPGDLITTINDDSRMKLDFTVPAIYLRSLQVDLPIMARSRALGDKVFEGKIYSIDNQIDPVTRAITVRALLPNDDRELKQGMLMSINLYANKRKALVISEAALVPLGSDNFVFVVQPQGETLTVERRQVTIGQRLRGFVEILNGLEADEKVVTHGLQKIRAGTLINITAEETGEESLSELIDSTKS
jgi:membrane fusion protein (multidrug efflux system)